MAATCSNASLSSPRRAVISARSSSTSRRSFILAPLSCRYSFAAAARVLEVVLSPPQGRALSNVAFAAGVAHTNTDTATFRITQRRAVAQRHQRASAPLLRSAVPNPIRGELKSSQKIPFFFALKPTLFAAIRIFVSPPLRYKAVRNVSESFVSPLCIPGVGARPGVGGSGPGNPQATPTGHR